MVEVAGKTRDRWPQTPRRPDLDVLPEMAQLTAEIICRSVFGRELGHEHAQQVVDSFSELPEIERATSTCFRFWVRRIRFRGRAAAPLRRAVQGIHDVLDGIIDSYRTRKKDKNDALAGRPAHGSA